MEKIRSKDYFYVHTSINIQDVNQSAIDSLDKNKELLFKNILREIPEKIMFNIEMYKFGRAFNALRSRWAILIRDEGLFSSPDPIYKKSKSKDKTSFLLNSTITCEKKLNQLEWSVPKKEYRIVIEFIDNSKKTKKYFYYLYFEKEEELKQCKEILNAIKIKKKGNQTLVSNLKGMQKMIEGSYLFYGVFKLLQVKQKIKTKKVLLNSMKYNIKDSLKPFNKFATSTVDSIKLNFFKNKKNLIFPKFKFLYSNKNLTTSNTDIKQHRFNSLSFLKSRINLIASKFPEYFEYSRKVKEEEIVINENETKIKSKFSLLASMNKRVTFKLNTSSYMSNLSTSNFDLSAFKSSKFFTINKNTIEVMFNDNEKCVLNRDDILNISNVFVNYNKTNELVISGPKKSTNIFLKYSYHQSLYPSIAHEKFVEPEYHSLTMTKNSDSLSIQIFHCIFVFGKRDIEYLETLNNYNFKFDNPLEDFYFYISLVLNENYKVRTRLVKAKKYENEKFIIEFNLEHQLLAWKNLTTLDLKVSLNVIPVKCFDSELVDEKEANFYVDYLNPYEMGFCVVNNEKIAKKESEFFLFKEGLNLPDENKIIMNFYMNSKETETSNKKKFYGNELHVGNDIYALEEINKKFLESRMNDNSIDPEIKEKLYNVKFSNDECILLRYPHLNEIHSHLQSNCSESEEDFYHKFKENSDVKKSISTTELENIFYNKKFNFIPHIEKFVSNNYLKEESKNLSLNSDSIVKSNSNLRPGDWIYKIKNLKKFFLGNFKGITENKKVVYHNYFFNEFQTNQIDSTQNMKEKYKCIQENLFGIYNLKEIDLSTLENVDNYMADWIKFH